MSKIEREHMKIIDQMILEASGEQLRRLQEIDLAGQLEAKTIYDLLAECRTPEKESLPQSQKIVRRSVLDLNKD